MSVEELREVLRQALMQVAPEADFGSLDPERRFRDQLDFDSVDFLNFALSLQERLGISIPEEDFPALGTLAGCLRYLGQRRDTAPPP